MFWETFHVFIFWHICGALSPGNFFADASKWEIVFFTGKKNLDFPWIQISKYNFWKRLTKLCSSIHKRFFYDAKLFLWKIFIVETKERSKKLWIKKDFMGAKRKKNAVVSHTFFLPSTTTAGMLNILVRMTFDPYNSSFVLKCDLVPFHTYTRHALVSHCSTNVIRDHAVIRL